MHGSSRRGHEGSAWDGASGGGASEARGGFELAHAPLKLCVCMCVGFMCVCARDEVASSSRTRCSICVCVWS